MTTGGSERTPLSNVGWSGMFERTSGCAGYLVVLFVLLSMAAIFAGILGIAVLVWQDVLA